MNVLPALFAFMDVYSRRFEDLAPHLQRRYRVVVPDLRGRGLSERDPNWNNYQPAIVRTWSAATFARMKAENPDLQQLLVTDRGHVPLLEESHLWIFFAWNWRGRTRYLEIMPQGLFLKTTFLSKST